MSHLHTSVPSKARRGSSAAHPALTIAGLARTAMGASVAAALLLAIAAPDSVNAQGASAAVPPATAAAGNSVKRSVTKPLWSDLTPVQQRALEPLAQHWDALTVPHKRKWLALSRNYANFSPAEQQTLHSRMTEWAALTQQERVQARRNFAEVKQLPADERKAKWEAYQALSEEEKRKLASMASSRPPGTASAVRPVPAQRLTPTPALSSDPVHMPRIQLAPSGAMVAGPLLAAPAPIRRGAPVSAEEQVPAPADLAPTPPTVQLPTPSSPSESPTVRSSDQQPSSSP